MMSQDQLSNPLNVPLWKTKNFLLKSLSSKYDIIIIGGGIIGTAIAKTIKENTKHAKIALLEKENTLAKHQSSHNSQVIHAGIHYRSDSLKAKLCVEGAELIYDYCAQKNIPVKKFGKLIIASDILDKFRLKELYKQGLRNKVPGLKLLNWSEVTKIQPHCRGLEALWSPNSGNIDWEIVTRSFGEDFKASGGYIFFNNEVKSIKESPEPSHPLLIEIKGTENLFLAKYVIISAGLHSGTLTDSERNSRYKNISLNCNYYKLNPNLKRFIKTNIYAMPHIDMPFIGIHFSPTVDGNVLLGPSAVPALKLDGYTNNKSAFDLDYIRNNIFSQHFGLLFLKNFQSCLHQITEKALSDVQTSALNKYFPMLAKHDIIEGHSAVQGQILSEDGEFVDDFLFEILEGEGVQKRIINCRFVPSPGATSSLAIARMIFNKISHLDIFTQ